MMLARSARLRLLAAGAAGVLVVSGGACTQADESVIPAESTLESLIRSGDGSQAIGTEIWEVTICRIPDSYDEALYDMTGVRLRESAAWIADRLEPVTEWVRRWSNGRYAVAFRAADHDVSPMFGGAQECVDAALDEASGVDGVVVIADAQHREDREGGWGRRGRACPSTCSPDISKRVMYLGASDFVSGQPVPLDLVEHELGHALDWPHSQRFEPYDSPIDVMSDSSAPRRRNVARLHAPGVLAVNRFLSGWMDRDPILVSASGLHSIEIDREQFVFVALTETSALTIEVVTATSDDDHLQSSGVAVHFVEWGPTVCSDPRPVSELTGAVCAGSARSQKLIAPDASPDGLIRAGERVGIGGVTIAVDSISDGNGSSAAAIRMRGR